MAATPATTRATRLRAGRPAAAGLTDSYDVGNAMSGV